MVFRRRVDPDLTGQDQGAEGLDARNNPDAHNRQLSRVRCRVTAGIGNLPADQPPDTVLRQSRLVISPSVSLVITLSLSPPRSVNTKPGYSRGPDRFCHSNSIGRYWADEKEPYPLSPPSLSTRHHQPYGAGHDEARRYLGCLTCQYVRGCGRVITMSPAQAVFVDCTLGDRNHSGFTRSHSSLMVAQCSPDAAATT